MVGALMEVQVEVQRDDGRMQARRCLEAMAGQDVDTRRSLWRAAVKFSRKSRAEAGGLEFSDSRSHAYGHRLGEPIHVRRDGN